MALLPRPIPYAVRIVNTTYEIDLRDRVVEGVECFGTVTYDPAAITLRGNLSPDHTAEVLVHEVIHAISAQLDLGLSEKQVLRLAGALARALIDCDVLHPLTATEEVPPDDDKPQLGVVSPWTDTANPQARAQPTRRVGTAYARRP